MKIIGLLGKKGAGKGTVATALKANGYTEIAFADPLYAEAAAAFNVTVEQLAERSTKEMPLPQLTLNCCSDPVFYGIASHVLADERSKAGATGGYLYNHMSQQFELSPRKLLQLWGTEYRRAADNFYWVKKLASRIDELAAQGVDKVCISDVREHMEAAWIKRRDCGVVVKIVRPANPLENLGTNKHSSETQIDTIAHDFVIVNDRGLDDLGFKAETDEPMWFAV